MDAHGPVIERPAVGEVAAVVALDVLEELLDRDALVATGSATGVAVAKHAHAAADPRAGLVDPGAAAVAALPGLLNDLGAAVVWRRDEVATGVAAARVQHGHTRKLPGSVSGVNAVSPSRLSSRLSLAQIPGLRISQHSTQQW